MAPCHHSFTLYSDGSWKITLNQGWDSNGCRHKGSLNSWGEAAEVIVPPAEGKAPAAHHSCGLRLASPRGPVGDRKGGKGRAATGVGAAGVLLSAVAQGYSSSHPASSGTALAVPKHPTSGRYFLWGLLRDGGCCLVLWVLALPCRTSSEESGFFGLLTLTAHPARGQGPPQPLAEQQPPHAGWSDHQNGQKFHLGHPAPVVVTSRAVGGAEVSVPQGCGCGRAWGGHLGAQGGGDA